MQIDRRQLALPALVLGLLTALPAFAGADEDAVLKNVEAFRKAQAAGNAEALVSLLAEDLSYSHSNAKVDTKASLLDGVAKANYKWTSLEYKDPTVKVVGPDAIVRFTFVGEQRDEGQSGHSLFLRGGDAYYHDSQVRAVQVKPGRGLISALESIIIRRFRDLPDAGTFPIMSRCPSGIRKSRLGHAANLHHRS